MEKSETKVGNEVEAMPAATSTSTGSFTYDYVVDSDAALVGLNNNTTAVNVLIKKGTYRSPIAVNIRANVKTIVGEGGNHLIFGSTGTAIDGLVCVVNKTGGPAGPEDGPTITNTLVVRGVKVTAERWAFNGFEAVYNCEGRVLTDSSWGPAAFYQCNKVVDCFHAVPAIYGRKIFAMDKCYNVRGCSTLMVAPNGSAPYRNSYSGYEASATYACDYTQNGGWNY